MLSGNNCQCRIEILAFANRTEVAKLNSGLQLSVIAPIGCLPGDLVTVAVPVEEKENHATKP